MSIAEEAIPNRNVIDKLLDFFHDFIPLSKKYIQDHPEWASRAKDVDAALKGKPDDQVNQELEVYPGAIAMAAHEEAHKLYKQGRFADARKVAEAAHAATGIDMHPGAKIHPTVFVDHGTGTVVGEEAIIEEETVVYQNVTLGAFRKAEPGKSRHPHVGKRVTLSTGATVLGPAQIDDGVVIHPHAQILGDVHVGANTTIGPNVVIEAAPGKHIDIPSNYLLTVDHIKPNEKDKDELRASARSGGS